MLAAVEEAVVRRAWGAQEELLATLIEVTDELRIAFLTANTRAQDRYRIPAPLRVPRPGVKTAPRKVNPGELLMNMTRG